MSNYKWNDNDSNTIFPYVVVLMISRNKDNKDIENFKERRASFFTTFDDVKIQRKFNHFVEDGVPGEFCRLYISNNSRDPKKVHQKLLHFLIDNPNFNFDYIEGKVAGLAAEKECAEEHKWMFDFDIDDNSKVEEFINDIHAIDANVVAGPTKTPHGYAVITSRGFDTRELFKKWTDVTLKRDDLICYDWRQKE